MSDITNAIKQICEEATLLSEKKFDELFARINVKRNESYEHAVEHTILPKILEPLSRQGRTKPCFGRHLGYCPGVCTGEIEQTDYNKIIKNL